MLKPGNKRTSTVVGWEGRGRLASGEDGGEVCHVRSVVGSGEYEPQKDSTYRQSSLK